MNSKALATIGAHARLVNKRILLICGSYFYTGEYVRTEGGFVLLQNPSIVYETGSWSDKTFKLEESLHTDLWYVQISHIESAGLAK